MTPQKQKALAEFRKSIVWITALAVVTVVGALFYISWAGELTVHLVVATILGVFISMMLGCGLFALAFFSDKSGHDDDVTDATRGAGQDTGSDSR